MNRALVEAVLAGGKVYVAEYDDVGIVGTAVWFGPGEGFMKTYASKLWLLCFDTYAHCVAKAKHSSSLDLKATWPRW